MIELSENISKYLLEVFGEEYLEKYKSYVESEPDYYIRTLDPNIPEKLIDYNITLEQNRFINTAYKIIEGKEAIGKSLEFTFGKYYVQSLSSMIPPIILNPSENDIVMDLCAAPGSKSTQLSEIMNNKGTLCVNEPNLNRIKSLAFNVDKMTSVNVSIIKQKGELLSKYFENTFDKILVDAPCSALGIVQKRGEVSNWWNEKQMEKIAELQLRLLISAVKMAKVGGEIVYSTCTLTLEENELVLNKVLKNYPVELTDIELPLPSHNAFTNYENEELNPQISKAKRIIPWEVESEGFFIGKLIKKGNTEPSKKADVKNRGTKLLDAEHREIKKYLHDVSEWFGIPAEILSKFKYLIKGNDINFIDGGWALEDADQFLRMGIRFGNIDKRGMCHLHSLAVQNFSNYITKNIFEIRDKEELKNYLSGGTIKREIQPYGQKAVKYKNLFMGTAIAFNDGIKSQLPRSMRTHDIFIPEK